MTTDALIGYIFQVWFLRPLQQGEPLENARVSRTYVLCLSCGVDPEYGFSSEDLHPKSIPLFRVNVFPYRQTCHGCGKVLCEGQTLSWPILFDKPSER